ncbi:MAG: hypothetical protein WBX16_11135, partial [Candidatus Acidiferrales bacterium]
QNYFQKFHSAVPAPVECPECMRRIVRKGDGSVNRELRLRTTVLGWGAIVAVTAKRPELQQLRPHPSAAADV